MEKEQLLEQRKLEEFLQVIDENLSQLRSRKEEVDRENKELYDAYMEGDTELYSALMVSSTLQEHVNRSIEANESAMRKTHFGRVDYLDESRGESYRLYIGKHGIVKDATEVMIVDWRAAAASIYYESSTGESSYRTPEGQQIPICLKKKRTFDIDGRRLIGFYDSDTAANDELLIKYLAKNKDVVLGEIIATIQQEQNTIIRERHNRSMIVQGVAGSGKTTVAVHRISYLLYNFSERYDPSEICIIGSNDVLLNYIASGLPSLDVYNTKQYRMEQLFEYLIGAYLPAGYVLRSPSGSPARLRLKSSIGLIQKAQEWTREEEARLIPRDEVKEKGKVLLAKESIDQYLKLFADRSITSKLDNLTGRLNAGIKLAMDDEEPDVRKEVQKKYRRYFYQEYRRRTLPQLYLAFLMWMEEKQPDSDVDYEGWISDIQKKRYDVYDLAAMAMLAYGWLEEKEDDEFAQMYIDEAQDYGAAVYYVLRKRMPRTVFMIMGDVSQNIHYDSGMNDWRELREAVLNDPEDRFYTLCKSYRNTIEISNFAAGILSRSNFETYPIEPIVRHGKPVALWQEADEGAMEARARVLLEELKQEEYQTIALICRDETEAEMLEMLVPGYTILPLALTKGLEFDAVVLWNPNCERYAGTDQDAKLLYVAVTRALHELHILYTGELCELLQPSAGCPPLQTI